MIMWVVTAVAILGTILNVKKIPMGFTLWIITNVFYVVHNIQIGQKQQALLFAVYLGLAVWGLVTWMKDKKGGVV